MAWHHTICENKQGTRFCENELVTGDFDVVVIESVWTSHKGLFSMSINGIVKLSTCLVIGD